MESLVLAVPAMYADHHVVEARRLLLATPGVETVDASSAFQVVEIGFDPERTSVEGLRQLLDAAGYLNELDVPLESGDPALADRRPAFFRRSTAHEIAGTSIAFEQKLAAPNRPHWPGPGGRSSARSETGGEDD